MLVAASTVLIASPANAATGSAVTVSLNGKCLDADLNTINRNGTKVQLWQCNGQDQQKWYLNSDGTIHSGYNGWCLDADTNTADRNGAVVQLWQCNGTAQQRWSNIDKHVRSGLSNRCLDADTNTANNNGGVVQLWDCNNTSQQTWSGLAATSWTSACTAYSNDEIWQTSQNIGRVRERVCVLYSPATVWSSVEFQLDWPSQCSLSVGFPPSAGASCPTSTWLAKNHQLQFNGVQITGYFWVGETQQGNNGSCTWGGSKLYVAPGAITYSCRIAAAARTANGRHYSVIAHDTGADVADDGDGWKLLAQGSSVFTI